MIYLTLFFIALFGANMLIERRTLWSGLTFGLACASSLFYLLVTLEQSALLKQWPWLSMLLYLVVAGLALVLLAGPLLLELTFLYNGVKILRREGLSLRNALSLGMAILIPIYLFGLPYLPKEGLLPKAISWLPTYIGVVIIYMITQASLYTLSSLINMVNFPRKNLNYIVVLGAGLMGTEVTPLLASRIDKAIAIYRQNPNAQLIMSGGQGADEAISEAQAMTNYALRQGIPKEAIILENQATNTEENITLSILLMKERPPQFAIVSNSYHIFRALLIARKEGIKCIGYGAPSKFYFSLNAFIREFVAYLVMTRKRHLFLLIGLLLLIVLFHTLTTYILPSYLSPQITL